MSNRGMVLIKGGALAGASLVLSACSTTPGTVSVAGKFLTPAPAEVRYMLDKGYGLNGIDVIFAGDEIKPQTFMSAYPDRSGMFASKPQGVSFHGPPMKAPPPAYWLSFSNEKGVIYNVEIGFKGIAYSTLDANTKAPLDRAMGCWVIKDGEYFYPPEQKDRGVILRIIIDKNPAATKSCSDTQAR
jgi:hypothetical protein